MMQWRTEGLFPEVVGVWFVATFATALVLAGCSMALTKLVGFDSEVRQPWFALLLWGLAAIIGVVAARTVQNYRRRQMRLANGFCFCCGYDLRGTAERCPECGNVPMKAKA